MVLKTTFRLSKQRAFKMRKLAEYYASQEGTGVDTEATLNQLIDYAYDLIEDEKRAAAQRSMRRVV